MNTPDIQQWADEAIAFAHDTYQSNRAKLNGNRSLDLCLFAAAFLKENLPEGLDVQIFHYKKDRKDKDNKQVLPLRPERKWPEHYFIAIGVPAVYENNQFKNGAVVCFPYKHMVMLAEKFSAYLNDARVYKNYKLDIKTEYYIGQAGQELINTHYDILTFKNIAISKKINDHQSNPDFEIACAAKRFAEGMIIRSSTQLGTGQSAETIKSTSNRIYKQRLEAERQIGFLALKNIAAYNFLNFLNNIRLSQNSGDGNCWEFSAHALFWILKNYPHKEAYILNLESTEKAKNEARDEVHYKGDHTILQVGGFFCDPSNRKVYPKNEAAKNLRNYVPLTTMDPATREKNQYNTVCKVNGTDYKLTMHGVLNTSFIRSYYSKIDEIGKQIKQLFLDEVERKVTYFFNTSIINDFSDLNEKKLHVLKELENINMPNDNSIQSQMELYGNFQNKLGEITALIAYKINNQYSHGETPVYFAVGKNDIELVTFLLQHDADANVRETLSRETPLYAAVYNENMPLVELLLKHNANIDVLDDLGRTCLHLAVIEGNKKVAEFLLDRSSNPDLQDQYGMTALHDAVMQDNYEMTNLLLGNMADPNLKNKYGNTPLHLAVAKDSVVIIRYLLGHTANPNIQNTDGNTPLHLAVNRGKVSFVEYLLNKKANLNIHNNDGNTPLHIAVMSVNPSLLIIEKLLANGVTLDLKNVAGNTPLDLINALIKVDTISEDKKDQYCIIQTKLMNAEKKIPSPKAKLSTLEKTIATSPYALLRESSNSGRFTIKLRT